MESGDPEDDAQGPLLCAKASKAALEGRNGAEQLEYISQLVEGGAVKLRESHVLQLQALAVQDIYPCAGHYRTAIMKVWITHTDHVLPEAAFVPTLVRDAADFINDEAGTHGLSALEKAAYALWRFNWIHPFAGGNGRTSRAVAYLILCMARGYMLPGVPTMPTLIYDHRDEYLEVLQRTDVLAKAAGDDGRFDLHPMADFLKRMVVHQLATVVDDLDTPKPARVTH